MVLAPARAHGQKPVLLECYVGKRPEDADRYVGPVLTAAQARFRVGPDDVGKEWEERYSRPGLAVELVKLDDVPNRVDDGFRKYANAAGETARQNLGEAIASLEPIAAMLLASPAALVADTDLQAALKKALVGVAMAHQRLGHAAEALEAMAELLRVFPGGITRKDFGSDPFEFSRAVKKKLEAQGRGSIHVSVDEADASVFVDSRLVAGGHAGAGEFWVTDALPGIHRIYVRKGAASGRLYGVNVAPGQTAGLRVTWGFDEALHTSPGWAGLVYRDAEERDRSLFTDLQRVRRELDATMIGAVCLEDGARRKLWGVVYSATRTDPIRERSFALEPVEPSEEQLALFGAYLALETDTPPPEEIVPPPAPEKVSAARGTRRWWLWGGIGGGVALTALGAGLIAFDGTPTCNVPDATCPEEYATRTPGIVTIGVGVGAIAVSTWLLLRHSPSAAQPISGGVFVDHDRAGVVVGGTF